MSNFSNVGKRERVRAEKRIVKRHLKRMYAIMDELDNIAMDIIASGDEWSEDNIEELAANYTELKLGDMERFLLLGKLQQANEAKNNTK